MQLHHRPPRSGRPRIRRPAAMPPATPGVLVLLADQPAALLSLSPRTRALAGATSARQQASLQVRELSRKQASALTAGWPDGEQAGPRFGSRTLALFSAQQPVAVLTAANTCEQQVDRRLGLTRANCVELVTLTRPQEQPEQPVLLLLALWRELLHQRGWPYYPDVEKVALISYSQSARVTGALGRAGGWRQAPARPGATPFWVCWLQGPPAGIPAAPRSLPAAPCTVGTALQAAA